jgi:uncharacterized membrane protein YqjE
MDPHSSSEASETGLLAGLNGVVRNVYGLLVTRLELAAIEVGEARDHFVRLLLVGALGVLLICFALAGWSALIVVLAWEALGWKILLLLAALYTLLAAGVLLYASTLLARNRLSLPATMAELRSDRDALF